MRSWLRRISTWKYLFYELILPSLRLVGPRYADAVIGMLGRWVSAVQPVQRARLRQALARVRAATEAEWSIEEALPRVAANRARFLARDYPLDGLSDQAVLERFDVRGHDGLRAALAGGRGAIIVGSHLGAHIAGIHWLYRRGVPVRLLVQRPKHVSRYLIEQFDADERHTRKACCFCAGTSHRRRRWNGSWGTRGPARRPGRLFERRRSLDRPQHVRWRVAGPT